MQSVPIVLAFTPNYIIPAATTIQSILDHSDKTDTFEILCLLTEELSSSIKNSLESWCPERLKFKYIAITDQLEGVYIDERYTAAASFRLLLADILPDYKKIIYSDCDVIVRNNIADLYRQVDLSDNYVGAVYEAALDFQIPYLRQLGIEPGKYFNSGFLIMNLEQMRIDNITSALIEKSNNPHAQFPDQDALNLVCKGSVLPLSPIYNSIRTYFLPQYKGSFLKYYSQTDWDAVQHTGTIHYTGAKPWNTYTIQFDTWWKYYERLPQSLRQTNLINKRIYLYAKLFRQPFIKYCFSMVQKIYRKLK